MEDIQMNIFACENLRQAEFFADLQKFLDDNYVVYCIEQDKNGEYITVHKKLEINFQVIPAHHWFDVVAALSRQDEEIPPLLIGEKFGAINLPVVCVPYQMKWVKAYFNGIDGLIRFKKTK